MVGDPNSLPLSDLTHLLLLLPLPFLLLLLMMLLLLMLLGSRHFLRDRRILCLWLLLLPVPLHLCPAPLSAPDTPKADSDAAVAATSTTANGYPEPLWSACGADASPWDDCPGIPLSICSCVNSITELSHCCDV